MAHITGTDGRGHGLAAIKASRWAGTNDYQSRLKSLTGGQGSYTIEFARYAAVPPTVTTADGGASSNCGEDE